MGDRGKLGFRAGCTARRARGVRSFECNLTTFAMLHSDLPLGHYLLGILLCILFFGKQAHGSIGDRLPEFKSCVAVR